MTRGIQTDRRIGVTMKIQFSTWQNIYGLWIAAPDEPGVPCFIDNGETPEEAKKDCKDALDRWEKRKKIG